MQVEADGDVVVGGGIPSAGHCVHSSPLSDMSVGEQEYSPWAVMQLQAQDGTTGTEQRGRLRGAITEAEAAPMNVAMPVRMRVVCIVLRVRV